MDWRPKERDDPRPRRRRCSFPGALAAGAGSESQLQSCPGFATGDGLIVAESVHLEVGVGQSKHNGLLAAVPGRATLRSTTETSWSQELDRTSGDLRNRGTESRGGQAPERLRKFR